MKIKGKIAGISRDYITGLYCISLNMIEGYIGEIEALIGEELSVEIKKWFDNRSNKANRLLWHCIQEISAAQKPPTKKWDEYLRLLKDYGVSTYICVKPQALEYTKRQWRECEEIGPININGQEAIQLLCFFGSSVYNTKDFSRLLDGAIEDMRNLGLPLPLASDVKAALDEWEKQYEKHNSEPA